MKAAVIEEYGSLLVKDIPAPKPGEYDALCELLYGATCTGTDSHIIAGQFPWLSPLPTVLGHESVGRVIEVGSKVRNFKVGDLVTRVGTVPTPDGAISVNWGGFAELGIAKDHWAMAADACPESEWAGARHNQIVPADVDPRVAPMFTTWRETLSYVNRMGIPAGASVLVVGSGGNGLAYATHARNLGAAHIAMVGSKCLAEAVQEKAGVGLYVDYKSDDVTGLLKDGVPDGFDFMIDAVGQTSVCDQVLPSLKPGGVYGTYGIDDFGAIRINPAAASGDFTVHAVSYAEHETHQEVSELVLQGKLDASLWYDVEKDVYPLDDIAKAFEDVTVRRTSPKALIKLQ